jgi:ketosteroid isomerase-like protein
MKKIFLFMFVAAMFFACQPKTKTVPVDTAAAKVAVNNFMDTYQKLWNAKDVNALLALLTEDGLFCGTDPSELLDKKLISEAWKQAFADTTLKFIFSVDKREIRINSDGNSALVMEQFGNNPFTPKIMWRLVSHLVKEGDGWKIDFISWNLIPKNEDIGKLNKALE